MRITLNPLLEIMHKTWGEETVLYDNVSGYTHLVDDSVMQILAELKKGERGIEQLQKLLMQYFDDASEEEIAAYLQTMLTQLIDVGLIEMVQK